MKILYLLFLVTYMLPRISFSQEKYYDLLSWVSAGVVTDIYYLDYEVLSNKNDIKKMALFKLDNFMSHKLSHTKYYPKIIKAKIERVVSARHLIVDNEVLNKDGRRFRYESINKVKKVIDPQEYFDRKFPKSWVIKVKGGLEILDVLLKEGHIVREGEPYLSTNIFNANGGTFKSYLAFPEIDIILISSSYQMIKEMLDAKYNSINVFVDSESYQYIVSVSSQLSTRWHFSFPQMSMKEQNNNNMDSVRQISKNKIAENDKFLKGFPCYYYSAWKLGERDVLEECYLFEDPDNISIQVFEDENPEGAPEYCRAYYTMLNSKAIIHKKGGVIKRTVVYDDELIKEMIKMERLYEQKEVKK